METSTLPLPSKKCDISPNEAFHELTVADSFDDVLDSFQTLCESIGWETSGGISLYEALKCRVNCCEATTFFQLLDAQFNKEVYKCENISKAEKVLVIGGGPCGLRSAIECTLLGAHAVLLEKRKSVTRNNVLYVWTSAANDLKALGAKVFYPKFCVGSIHHCSIRRMQLILMKIALLIGVEIHAPATFQNMIPPNPLTGRSWQANVTPSECPVNNYEFSVVIGADALKNSLNFPRVSNWGKVAIAITANFKNLNRAIDTQVSEIPGVMSIMKPDMFAHFKKQTGLVLENFLYYRDESHYFIMTVKKKSMITNGFFKEEFSNLRELIHPSNINRELFIDTVRQLADIGWKTYNPNVEKLPELDFVQDKGQDDAAMFDFAALYHAKHPAMIKERHGHKLFMCVVGDTLIEPFWPSGSGVTKGFLGVQDTIWSIKHYLERSMPDLEILAERESMLRILLQGPHLAKDLRKMSIDPSTRYYAHHGKKTLGYVKTKEVEHLYDKSNEDLEVT